MKQSLAKPGYRYGPEKCVVHKFIGKHFQIVNGISVLEQVAHTEI
jgi:hypothetical protein